MDTIIESWLARQRADATALAADSNRLAVFGRADRPQDLVVRFDCLTMARVGGEVRPWDRGVVVLFHFPRDYLRVVRFPELIALVLEPQVFHPNVSPTSICVGHIAPGTGLAELIYRVHDVLTFTKLSTNEHDALNPAACVWARANLQRFPLDDRPLLRRATKLDVRPANQGARHEA